MSGRTNSSGATTVTPNAAPGPEDDDDRSARHGIIRPPGSATGLGHTAVHVLVHTGQIAITSPNISSGADPIRVWTDDRAYLQ